MPRRISAAENLDQRTRCGVRTAGLVAALLLAAPLAVNAQEPVSPGAWYLSPSLGVSLDPDGQAASTVAGALGYAVTRQVMLEGEVSHIFDRADAADVESALTTAAAAVLYHFGEQSLRPYLAAGVGVGWLSHELHQLQLPPAEVSATAFAVNLGGGVTYAVTPRVGVRGDFRYFNYTHGESSDPANLVIIDDVPSAWRFAGALTLRLGS